MMARLPLHVDVGDFEVRDNNLVLGTATAADILEQHGDTPIFVYVRQRIVARVETLRRILPGGVSLHYAIKANPMPAVVRALVDLVDGIDVASAGELATALAAGASPGTISFAGPGKKLSELEAAVAAGVVINVESATELQRLVRIAESRARRPRVAIRVNPDFELKSSGMKMAGGSKQFGIDAELVPDLLRTMADMPVDFEGFHIFSGSQNLSAAAICESQQKALELAVKLSESAPVAPRSVNIGGGFGIPYFRGDAPLDLSPIAANMENIVAAARRDLPGAEIVLELGRYLVGEAGVYLCRVVDRKVSRGRPFLITDGGLHHHLAATGNFGQVLRKDYPVLIANRILGDDREVPMIVGPLCTPLDLLSDRTELPKAQIGDIVAIFQSGAYGFSASPHRFLGHPPPHEVLV